MLDRLRDIPSRQMAIVCGATVLVVGAIDWFTGPDLQVLVLYLVPVLASAWYIGPRFGTGFAIATAVVTLSVAVVTPGGHSPPVAMANAVLRLLLLLLALRLVASERRHLHSIQDVADLDPLTRALNRRAFAAAVATRLQVRDATPGTLLYLDVDGLKVLNDAQGHDAGDRHLQALADIIRASIRADDHFARMGGDEFAVFLTGQDVTSAHGVAARLVSRCAKRSESPIRLSIGVAGAQTGADARALDHLLRRADDVMYEAKRSGGGVRVDRSGDAPQSDAG